MELFAGTSAISFNIWKEYGDKFTYHLNDLDGDLYNMYKLLKEENIDVIFDKINDFLMHYSCARVTCKWLATSKLCKWFHI
jgi:site-specific DNA-adenine methylase